MNCHVCGNDFDTGDHKPAICTAQCGKSFCTECYKKWYNIRQECPFCKGTLKLTPIINRALLELLEEQKHKIKPKDHRIEHRQEQTKTVCYKRFFFFSPKLLTVLELHCIQQRRLLLNQFAFLSETYCSKLSPNAQSASDISWMVFGMSWNQLA